MRMCPICKEYGDVWEVEFMDLNGRRAVMCFECDLVWETVDDDEESQVIDNFESIMKKHGFPHDWSRVKKIRRVLPEP